MNELNSKHIEMDCHFARDCVMSEMICTPFTLSEQLVDIFTKVVTFKVFLILCSKLNMIDIYASG